MFTLAMITEDREPREANLNQICISQFQLRPATPLPRATAGHLPALSVALHGICQPRGHSRAFDTHAVSHQNITTQKVLLKKNNNKK